MRRENPDNDQARPRSRAERTGRRWWFLPISVLALVAGIVLYGLLGTGVVDEGTPTGDGELASDEATLMVNRGSPTDRASLAPDVTLATADGQLRLSDLRGQPLLLYFSFPG
ncbi:MAG: hypothetical protein HY680_06240 [Chloroflexi bacterium]|nr:hypothetical protein [Chloroflexota bacterium]